MAESTKKKNGLSVVKPFWIVDADDVEAVGVLPSIGDESAGPHRKDNTRANIEQVQGSSCCDLFVDRFS
jgi:hypothetical protein